MTFPRTVEDNPIRSKANAGITTAYGVLFIEAAFQSDSTTFGHDTISAADVEEL